MSNRLPFVALAVLLLPAAAFAQPFIEHIEPPLAERGKTSRVTFVGHHLASAFDVWNSLPDGAMKAKLIKATPDRATFDLTTSPSASVGICGLRVATADGLSNLHLFLVDDLPVRPGTGNLTLPAAVWGVLREGASDRYTFTTKAGERLSFEAVASRFGKDADPLLTIRDESGRTVAERDNDPGLYFDSRFEHAFEKAGTYSIEVRDARYKGNEHRQYVLRMGRFPSARVALPLAVEAGAKELPANGLPGPFFATVRGPQDDGSAWLPMTTASGSTIIAQDNAEPTPASVPSTICGILRKPGARHLFALKLEKGQKLFVRGDTKPWNSPAEIDLALMDKTGKEIRRGTEVKGSDETTLEFVAGTAGDFQLVVKEGLRDGGDAFAYRLVLLSDPFPPQVTAEAEGLTVPQGSYQILPITITRSPGTKGAIALELLGAPPGVSLSPREIPENETAIVSKLEATSAARPGLYTLQILARSEGSLSLVRTQPLVDRKLVNIDLVPLALREDQRRLPFSTTDRLALQVSPPSPFTFELPEAERTLVRYQRVGIPIVTTRVPDFTAPISFSAEGGQLAPKEEGRTRVYAEFPEATAQSPRIEGFIQSLILSNLAKSRIKVTAAGTHQGRRVALTRSFDLDLVPGFKVKGEPAKVVAKPGEVARTRLVVQRVGTIDSEITIHFNTNSGLDLPETVVIPKGQDGIDFAVPIPVDTMPRRFNIQALTSGDVNGYEEEVRGLLFEIEVPKPEPQKKK